MSTGRILVKKTRATLCGYRHEAPCISGPFSPRTPTFVGDMASFLEKNPHLTRQCFNTVKKCTQCNKVCAITMESCNACGASLPTEITKSLNVFMGFIYGIEKTHFLPLRISLRYESPHIFVFDDPLALTPAHVCAVPRTLYIPTALKLYEKPKEGAALIRRLEEAAWKTIETQFLHSEPFKNQFLQESTQKIDLRSLIISGVNIPPSQYQLHIQFMLPPLLPQHYTLFQKNLHFQTGRFVPTTYLLDTLDALKKPIFASDLTQLASLVLQATGLDYYEYCSHYKIHVEKAHTILAKWMPSDFCYALLDDDETHSSPFSTRLLSHHHDDNINTDPSATNEQKPHTEASLFKEDTRRIQQYGRPYDDRGKPTGTYLRLDASLCTNDDTVSSSFQPLPEF